MLGRFCKKFEAIHGRETVLWIDKFCIDQQNIAAALDFLSIFVAASNANLVLYGENYFTRLLFLFCCAYFS